MICGSILKNAEASGKMLPQVNHLRINMPTGHAEAWKQGLKVLYVRLRGKRSSIYFHASAIEFGALNIKELSCGSIFVFASACFRCLRNERKTP
jgi:hypothetical protein